MEDPPARGRPRDQQLQERIVEAVNALLSEKGYDGVTFEEVARRCGASKASLYRRWSSKRDMVIAAIKAGPARHDRSSRIDTGSLRGDLLALCHRLDHTLRTGDSQTAMLLLQAGLEDPDLCDAIEAAVGPTGARLPTEMLEAATARGELPAGAHPFPFEEVVGAALLLRRVNGLAVDDAYLAALVDTIVLPALRATVDSRDPLPAGIFSGHPAGSGHPASSTHPNPTPRSEETP